MEQEERDQLAPKVARATLDQIKAQLQGEVTSTRSNWMRLHRNPRGLCMRALG